MIEIIEFIDGEDGSSEESLGKMRNSDRIPMRQDLITIGNTKSLYIVISVGHILGTNSIDKELVNLKTIIRVNKLADDEDDQ